MKLRAVCIQKTALKMQEQIEILNTILWRNEYFQFLFTVL